MMPNCKNPGLIESLCKVTAPPGAGARLDFAAAPVWTALLHPVGPADRPCISCSLTAAVLYCRIGPIARDANLQNCESIARSPADLLTTQT
jgi:hypothetical protein